MRSLAVLLPPLPSGFETNTNWLCQVAFLVGAKTGDVHMDSAGHTAHLLGLPHGPTSSELDKLLNPFLHLTLSDFPSQSRSDCSVLGKSAHGLSLEQPPAHISGQASLLQP